LWGWKEPRRRELWVGDFKEAVNVKKNIGVKKEYRCQKKNIGVRSTLFTYEDKMRGLRF
jgi:hypothetical protein